MNIVIVGAGEVGFHLADILSREDHRVSIIDPRPEKIERITESLDVQAVLGDGTQAELLSHCSASRADLVVAVTDNDYVNMLACRIARELGARRVIMRLRETERLAGYRYFYKRALGFDVVLSTDELAAEEILNTVREQNALEVEAFADGRVQLRRLRLRDGTERARRSLAELRLPAGVLIVAVARKERFFVPSGDDELAVDDQIYAMGRGVDLDAFERRAGEPARSRRSVVVMGGGGIGLRIAERLVDSPEISLKIIEQDRERAKHIGARLGKDVLVLVGDATDLNLLYEEGIDEANLFIATTGDDERNMVACHLARSLGIARTIAMVNKAAYRQIYDLLGIDRAISPRVLCANRILRFVRSASLFSIAVIAEGRAEVLELEAHFTDDKKKAYKVKNLGLPKGSVIGTIVRGEEVVVPTGETVVEDGDHLILFTLTDNLERVESLFRRVTDPENLRG